MKNRKRMNQDHRMKSLVRRRNEQQKLSRWKAEQAMGLFTFLLENSGKGRNAMKSVLARGQVSVNGKQVTQYNYLLKPGDQVQITWNHVGKAEPLRGMTIMYEDDDMIVINKQAGLLSIASAKEQDETAYRFLTEYVRRSNPKNRIFIVHRLDRDTSGVMIYAKSEKVQQDLQNAWKEAVPDRRYIALVEGEVNKGEGTIHTWLTESKTLRMFSSSIPNGGQEAITHYKVLEKSKAYSLLEVRLDTGRKNQIRVHMEAIGHPVAGDKKYGSKHNPIGRLGLHAYMISFYHPSTGELKRFETQIPDRFRKVFLSSD